MVGTREEVGGATAEGEQAPDGFEDRRANFVDVAGGNGCQEGSTGWMDGIGISGDAFGC